MKSKQLESTAFHEAGHALAHVWYETPFRRVSIVADDSRDSLGHVLARKLHHTFHPDLEITPATIRTIEKCVVINMAGPMAEAKFRGRMNHVGARKDYADSLMLIEYASSGPEETAAWMKLLTIRARMLIGRTLIWPAVTAVAAALMKQKTMTWANVRDVLARESVHFLR